MTAKKKAAALVLAGTMAIAASTLVAGQDNQGTVFRATTNYVSTDVVARDRDGKFVPNLTIDEFQVFEDGVLQTISTFRPMIGGRPMGGVTTATRNAPRATEGLILPPSRPATDTSGRIFIIFIDDLHLVPGDTPRVKELLKQIRDTVVHENDLVGFVSSGRSSIAIDPTYDFGHRRFDEAIGKVMGGGLTPQEIIEGATMEGQEGPTGLRYNAHVAFRTAHDMLSQLSSIVDRRKSFLWVSAGYTFNPFNESRFRRIQEQYAILAPNSGSEGENVDVSQVSMYDPLADPNYTRRTQFAESDLTSELAQLTRMARRANVAFYTIDPRGLTAGVDIEIAGTMNLNDWRDYYMRQADTLRLLADETGGFAIVQTNDFKRGLQRIDAETSDYYIIGYTSTNPDPFKIRRSVKVEVTRPGITDLIYRPEYTIPRPRGR